MTVEAYVDGACKGNPGLGGWGVYLIAGEHKKEIYGGEENTTNNKMELMAAIKCLQALKKEGTVITINTDSQYVKNGITTWIHNWKKNGWKSSNKQPVKNQDLWKELDNLCQVHSVSWNWVKGHSTNEGNNIADELANKGCVQWMED